MQGSTPPTTNVYTSDGTANVWVRVKLSNYLDSPYPLARYPEDHLRTYESATSGR